MVSVITIYESEKWDNIVKTFDNYDVYYLSGYVKTFQIHGDGEPVLLYFEDKDIRAINVIMKKDIEHDERFLGKIPTGSYFDLATPYGYGGFLIEGEKSDDNLKVLNDEYGSYCKDNGIISEFVRFHPVLENHKNLDSIYDVLMLGKTVSIDLKSTEHIWDDFTCKRRNIIRKAKKLGVEICRGFHSEMFDEFIRLYNGTMDRDNAKGYYYFEKEFYYSIFNELKDNAIIFYAVFEGKIIAMSIILFANQQLHCHLLASDREYHNVAPTNLLIYEAACWGCNNGYKTFHLGGGLGCHEDTLYKFKMGFNRNSDNSFFIGRKIFDYEKYDELIGIRREVKSFDENNTFFPAYRG